MLEPACKNKECDFHNIKVYPCAIVFYFRTYEKGLSVKEVEVKRIIFAEKLDSGAVIYARLCEFCAKDRKIIKRTLGND